MHSFLLNNICDKLGSFKTAVSLYIYKDLLIYVLFLVPSFDKKRYNRSFTSPYK